jgi:hypothetical protein
MTESDFRALVERHDLTYTYSDDHTVWERGRAQYAAIVEAAKSVPNAAEIWNANVDRKLIPVCRPLYYWPVTEVEFTQPEVSLLREVLGEMAAEGAD